MELKWSCPNCGTVIEQPIPTSKGGTFNITCGACGYTKGKFRMVEV